MKTSYRAKQKNFKRSRKISRSGKSVKEQSPQIIYNRFIPGELSDEILQLRYREEIIDEEEEIFPDSSYDFT